MNRDMELVRKILLAMEAEPSESGPMTPNIDGYDRPTISHHIYIMGTGGLISTSPETYQGDGRVTGASALNIEWDGYEFLDKVRDPGTWDRIKTVATAGGKSLGSTSMGVLTRIAAKVVMEQIGISDSP